jgi:hypothetical protein
LIADAIEIYDDLNPSIELSNMDVVIVENEDDLDHLTIPLCTDAIGNERQVPESKTYRYPGDFNIIDMENIDKTKFYFCCTQQKA